MVGEQSPDQFSKFLTGIFYDVKMTDLLGEVFRIKFLLTKGVENIFPSEFYTRTAQRRSPAMSLQALRTVSVKPTIMSATRHGWTICDMKNQNTVRKASTTPCVP